ncbi:MAG: hypothetical protein WCG84_01845 [Candidatus Moraniibacteriota bacterium]
MCYEWKKGERGIGISGQAHEWPNNSETLGQCSGCLINIPAGHGCGIENGKLVCLTEVRAKGLHTYTYGPEVLELLEKHENKAAYTALEPGGLEKLEIVGWKAIVMSRLFFLARQKNLPVY